MPQGTVKHFDPQSRTGSVLTDDQHELAIDAATFAGSGLLELRLGQRVRFELDGEGDDARLTALQLVSL